MAPQTSARREWIDLLAWTLGLWGFLTLVIGIPIHVACGVRLSSIALFVLIQCGLQIAATQWMFAGRATAENPMGHPERGWIIAVLWMMLSCEAVFLQMFASDSSDHAAVVIFLSCPVVLGLIFIGGRRWFIRIFDLEASCRYIEYPET
jgi:hypothetical protein